MIENQESIAAGATAAVLDRSRQESQQGRVSEEIRAEAHRIGVEAVERALDEVAKADAAPSN